MYVLALFTCRERPRLLFVTRRNTSAGFSASLRPSVAVCNVRCLLLVYWSGLGFSFLHFLLWGICGGFGCHGGDGDGANVSTKEVIGGFCCEICFVCIFTEDGIARLWLYGLAGWTTLFLGWIARSRRSGLFMVDLIF